MKSGNGEKQKIQIKKQNIWSDLGSALNLSWEVALPIFLGVLTGYFLDKNLNSPINFTLILLVFGVLLSFYRLINFGIRGE